MSEFTDYLADVFVLFGDIAARRMFGGHGIYRDNCMFGLVADDTLYLKADQENVHFFNELDLPPFTYEKAKGGTMSMSFYLAPESIYEDQDEAAEWAAHAWAAARRAKIAKDTKKKKSLKKKVAKKGVVTQKVAQKDSKKVAMLASAGKTAKKSNKKVAKKISKKVNKKR